MHIQNVVDECWGKNLFAGSHPTSFGENASENLQLLDNKGIDNIYSFEKNYSDEITPFWQERNKQHTLTLGMTKMTVPDFDGPSINQLTEFVETVSKQLKENQKIFIHCRGGLGRTGTFLAAFYIYKTQCSVDEAITKIREIYQPLAIESKEQIDSLHLFRASLDNMFFGLNL